MEKAKINKVDIQIIDMLKKNARTPNTEIAKRLGMVPSAILERIRKLEKKGIIQGYRVQVNPIDLGYNLMAFVKIKTNTVNWSQSCENGLLKLDSVEEIHEVMGEDSYLIKVRARDINHLSEIVKDKIGKTPDVKSTHTVMVYKTIKSFM